jgi:hypothetical protein
MNANDIRAFAQPTWELYRDSVLSVEGATTWDVEGKIVYEAYHKKVMAGNYDSVGIIMLNS